MLLLANRSRFNHTPWIYAFRFLRVFLSLQIGDSLHEHAAAIQHLHAIQKLAEVARDDAVLVTAATVEAMAHLRSGSAESTQHAQRAVAAARTLQLKPSVEGTIDQIWAMLDCIDLACSLLDYNPDQAGQKMDVMQKLLDEKRARFTWADDGSFAVPINLSYDMSITNVTNGIFDRTERGQDKLKLSWLNWQDLYALGFHMSGLASHLKSSMDKAQKYYQEGLKAMDGKPDSLHS
jgi:Cohesin loading factor